MDLSEIALPVTSSGSDQALELRLPSSTALLSLAREAVRQWMTVNQQPLDHWDVAVTELVANAVKASDPHGGQVSLGLDLTDGEPLGVDGNAVLCWVTNGGTWLTTERKAVPLNVLADQSPPSHDPHGRGLQLVSELCSGGAVTTDPQTTTVMIWKPAATVD